ncbi:hypothetical protein HCN51_57275 [Nonomuraea sp. FMUSA5-5]|uniref:Uncharacterized protein n=1 Tax=Nonomuraea composti TaxID=2720023 RepID=A0ABX1BMD1_9ACTN|nr:hypothetical protein [Nonomuraea sp. FMUSA5-5]NJP98875.1 hypothetical protein [Nonomuraea sp. FMUSA5-5]
MEVEDLYLQRARQARADAQLAAACLQVVRARLKSLALDLPAEPVPDGIVFQHDRERSALQRWHSLWRRRIAGPRVA